MVVDEDKLSWQEYEYILIFQRSFHLPSQRKGENMMKFISN